MDLYMYFGVSTPIDVLTTTSTREAAGDQGANNNNNGYLSSPDVQLRRPSSPPVAVASKRCTASRSVGEINSTSDDRGYVRQTSSSSSDFIKTDSSSSFRRALSNSFNQSLFINRTSLRKHQSLKETKNPCQSAKTEDPSTKVAQVGPRGVFWRASKRLFSSSILKPASSTVEEAEMPAPKVTSRDDAQISTRQSHKARQRQRTASPPSDLKKEEKQIDASAQHHHTSPFRSLPNAKKKLVRSLMKWTSPGSSTACVASSARASEAIQSISSGQGKSNKRGTNTRLDDRGNSASSPNISWKQGQVQSASKAVHHVARKSDFTHRVQECVKDLHVSLRFLDDVVKKDKLLMLDGSASIVLDTVLKLLLILNEKRRRECAKDESQVFLRAYNAVYHDLAALLKFADHLVVKNETASPAERQETARLCQALKDSIQVLLAVTANELPFEEPKKNGASEAKKNVTDRGVTVDMEMRKSSLTSTNSMSSSTDDWAAEDEGEARLQHLDNSFGSNDQTYVGDNNSRRSNQANQNQERQSVGESASSMSTSRPVSSVSTSSSGCCTSSKNTQPPSTLQLNQRHAALGSHISPANQSNGSRSPPGSDSGIFSLNDTGASASFLAGGGDNSSLSNSSLTAVPNSVTTAMSLSSPVGEGPPGSSSMFLDEILAKLKLDGVSTATFQEKICDQQDTSNGDVETVTEEVEEMVGDTKIIRKKVITRQKVRHQQVVTATITTHHPVIDSSNSSLLHLLTSPILEDFPWKKRTPPDDAESELQFVDSECYKLVGGATSQATETGPSVIKSPETAVSYESLPPAAAPPLPPRAARPVSDYDNEKESANLQLKNSKNGSETKILTNKQRQQCSMQQSASLQSFSRQTLFNGKLIKTETGEKFDTSAMKTSKSETFDDQGRMTECRGAGSYAECSYAKGDRMLSPPRAACCSEHQMKGLCGCGSSDSRKVLQKKHPGSKGLPPQPPPRPPKRSVVSSYVQLFGTGTPSNQADFRSSTLATYVQLRDRWNDHFEAHKRKAMTFQFVSTPVSSSSPSNANGTAAGANGFCKANDSPSSNSSSSSSPKISVNRISRSFQEYEVDGEEGVPVWLPRKPQDDYQNLVNILNVNDYLKFPKQAAVEAGAERKPLPFRANLALTDINLLDEIDVRQRLICKKTASDDGPEIRGGPIDALIVHATKTTSDAVSACGQSSNTHGHGFCYQEAFLTTYRTFVAPLELIRKLVCRYNKFNSCVDDSVKKKAAKNTFSLLVRVVDDLSAVEVSDDIMRLLSDFVYRMILDGELNFSRLLRQKLMERYKIKRQRALEDNSPLYPTVTSGAGGTNGKYSSVLDFKASLLAEQFTFLDWYYFQKIELSEMLLWAQEQSEENSPNLTNFTEHFNKMSYWVRTRILEQTDQRERERVFAKFVKIMRHLRRLNNFNSCLALLSALDSGPIRRLDWTKASVESMNEHSSLIDSSQSFKTYRMALAEAKPPCLPYIGLILQDLTFVHIGNPNTLPPDHCQGRPDMLNFAKRWQQYTILDNMRRFKAWPYGFKKSDHVLSFLNDFNDYVSEDAMWDISEKVKPRPQQTFVGGLARRILVNPS